MKMKCIAGALLSVFATQAVHERRCALDIGSALMKMQLAVIDTETQTIVELIGEPLTRHVFLGNYFIQDGFLNEAASERAIAAFRECLDACKKYNITKLSGVGTAVFRKAGASGAELFNTLQAMAYAQFGKENVSLQIITQSLEGELGFLTAAALLPDAELKNIVAWDSGNASFQIVMQGDSTLVVHEGPWGTSTATQHFVEKIRKELYTMQHPINPIRKDEIDEFIAHVAQELVFPDYLYQKVADAQTVVVATGDLVSMFALAFKILGKTVYTKDDVYSAIISIQDVDSHADAVRKLDSQEPNTTMIRLLLLYAVMEKLAIPQVMYCRSTGNTLGILLAPEFWQ